MDDYFKKCNLCPQYGKCIFADTPISCAWDEIARDVLHATRIHLEQKDDKNDT